MSARNKSKRFSSDRFIRSRRCYFKANKIDHIDYKDLDLLRYFISENGRILASRLTGTSSSYQRKLSKAIKRARYLALIPYCDLHKIK